MATIAALIASISLASGASPNGGHGFLHPWMQMSSDCLNLGRAFSAAQQLLDPDPAAVRAADAKFEGMPKALLDRVSLRFDQALTRADLERAKLPLFLFGELLTFEEVGIFARVVQVDAVSPDPKARRHAVLRLCAAIRDRHANDRHHVQAVFALNRVTRQDAILTYTLLNEPRCSFRFELLRALRDTVPEPIATYEAIKFSRDRDAKVRELAAEILADPICFGGDDDLMRLSRDRDASVRRATLRGLPTLGDRGLTRRREMCFDRDMDVSRAALFEMGLDEDPELRRILNKVLRSRRYRELRDSLSSFMKGNDSELASEVARLLDRRRL